MNNVDALLLIKSQMDTLSPKSRLVARYIAANPDEVINCSITDLAIKTGVSQFAVLSCVRSLGYDGYSDFKISLALSLKSNTPAFSNILPADDPFTILTKTCGIKSRYISEAYNLIQKPDYNKIIGLITGAKMIGVFGLGYSSFAAEYLSLSLYRLGLNSRSFRDSNYQIIESSLLCEGDLAIAFSASGSTSEIVESVKNAKNNGTKTVVVTCHPKSPLTQYADYTLLTTYSDPVPLKETDNSILEQMTIASAISTAVANASPKYVSMFTSNRTN